jgi:hypothetical protein
MLMSNNRQEVRLIYLDRSISFALANNLIRSFLIDREDVWKMPHGVRYSH